MFCSPFRRRRRRGGHLEERELTREEAWHLYLAKVNIYIQGLRCGCFSCCGSVIKSVMNVGIVVTKIY